MDYPLLLQNHEYLAAVRHELQRYLPSIFGLHILQLGCAKDRLLEPAANIKHAIVASTTPDGADLCTQYAYLPFSASSIDAVLIAHALEFAQGKQRILEEAWRVLLPNGYLLLVGFNPYSIQQLCSAATSSRALPSSSQVCKWLTDLEFTIKATRYFSIWQAPMRNKLATKTWWYGLLHMIPGMRYFGNAYLIVAQKKMAPIIMLNQQFTKQQFALKRGSLYSGCPR